VHVFSWTIEHEDWLLDNLHKMDDPGLKKTYDDLRGFVNDFMEEVLKRGHIRGVWRNNGELNMQVFHRPSTQRVVNLSISAMHAMGLRQRDVDSVVVDWGFNPFDSGGSVWNAVGHRRYAFADGILEDKPREFMALVGERLKTKTV
jgi:hypothetical protein